MCGFLENSKRVKKAMDKGSRFWWAFKTPEDEIKLTENLRIAFEKVVSSEIERLANEIKKL